MVESLIKHEAQIKYRTYTPKKIFGKKTAKFFTRLGNSMFVELDSGMHFVVIRVRRVFAS